MIIERTESPQWTSNAYLVADREGGQGVLIDGNGTVEPLIARAQELGVEVAAVIVTHWHADHIAGIDRYRDAFDAPVYAHPWTKEALNGQLAADVLFNGTVGGTFAPGNTGFVDHRASVMRLMELDDGVRVHPGHTLPSTIGHIELLDIPAAGVASAGLNAVGSTPRLRIPTD